MTLAYLASFFRYARLSPTSLRVLRAAYEACGVFPEEVARITHELAMRSWAEFLAERIDRTIGWCRGGRS